MTLWAEVRHLHLAEHEPKKEIARRLKLDVKDGTAGHQPDDPAGAGVAAAGVAAAAEQAGPVAEADARRRQGASLHSAPRFAGLTALTPAVHTVLAGPARQPGNAQRRARM